jgi:hypothetical protein
MKQLGFTRVRPLAGGLKGWIEDGLPLIDRVVHEARIGAGAATGGTGVLPPPSRGGSGASPA